VIGLDTNVLARYIVADDSAQTPLAIDFIENVLTPDTPGFVSTIVVVELVWILERLYKLDQAQISHILRELIAAPSLVIDCNDELERALTLGHGGISDRLIHLLARSANCTKTVTFDKAFAQLDDVELLGVA
jgi:predicted nucleic-acid-binding protein